MGTNDRTLINTAQTEQKTSSEKGIMFQKDEINKIVVTRPGLPDPVVTVGSADGSVKYKQLFEFEKGEALDQTPKDISKHLSKNVIQERSERLVETEQEHKLKTTDCLRPEETRSDEDMERVILEDSVERQRMKEESFMSETEIQYVASPGNDNIGIQFLNKTVHVDKASVFVPDHIEKDYSLENFEEIMEICGEKSDNTQGTE